MLNFLGQIAVGLTYGLQYGLLALGLVLVYRSSRFINFAHGQVGVLAALVLGRMCLEWHVPYFFALLIALGFGGLVGAIIERLVVQRLFESTRLALLVATVGVTQIAFFLTAWKSSPFKIDGTRLAEHGYPVPLHFSWTIGRVALSSSQVLTLILAPAVALGLSAFFLKTETGRCIRAAASNPEAARLAGISVRRMSLLVWVIAGVLSALTAILQAPSTATIDISNLGPNLLVRGLAAALIAGLVDFRLAFAAGVGLGVVEQLAFLHIHVQGISNLVVLATVLVGVALRARALAATVRDDDDRIGAPASRPPLSERLRELHLARHLGRYGWAALLLVGLLLPTLPGLQTQAKAQSLTLIVAFAIVGLSLTVLSGWAGQISLGHFALLGFGAYMAAKAVGHHWAMPAVLMVAGISTAVLAVVIGLQALRFKGLFLAVATLTFAVVAPTWLFRQGFIAEKDTGNAQILPEYIRLPGIGTVDSRRQLYYLALLVAVLVVLSLRALRASGAGRALLAVRDNPMAASAHGLPPLAVKVVALAVSGFFAGVAGGLWAMAQGNFSFQAFDPSLSLTMLALAIVGGLGTLHGPIIGAFLVFAWPYLLPDQNTPAIRAISSGVLLLVVLLFIPGGVAALLERSRLAVLSFIERGLPPRAFGKVEGAPPLRVHELSIQFGGIHALERVTLEVGKGEIVGLIGGNGAGKSTLMNCVSGHLSPQSGRIEVFGQDVTGLAPEYRPALSLARTFQDARLYPGLTVRESVLVALDTSDRSGTASSLVAAPWVRMSERRKRAEVDVILERLGLLDRGDALINELSTGMRRLCGLATVIATRPGLVLLDEPTAGIAQREAEAFAPLLRSLRDDLGCAVLIVEHDMPMLMGLCDRIFCLENGAVIAEGTPAEVQANPHVIASYLGSETPLTTMENA